MKSPGFAARGFRKGELVNSDLCLSKSTTKQDLKQAWGAWISGLANWDWYATLTFRDPEPEELARGYTKRGWGYAVKAYKRFVEALPAPLGVGHWVRMFEYQQERGVPHVHALLSGVQDLRRDEAWSWWFQRYGLARILPYDNKLGAGYYLCKYVTKELGDVKFSDSLTGKS